MTSKPDARKFDAVNLALLRYLLYVLSQMGATSFGALEVRGSSSPADSQYQSGTDLGGVCHNHTLFSFLCGAAIAACLAPLKIAVATRFVLTPSIPLSKNWRGGRSPDQGERMN
jgi:hypothetical protein